MLPKIKPTNYLKSLPMNKHGKDFVVGDIHGCFEDFNKLLELIKFNEITDRIFSVGDIVDRGPNSLDCFKLLEKSWFYPIIGNHEVMMYDYFNKPLIGGWDFYSCGSIWLSNGGNWFETLSEIDKKYIIQNVNKIKNLPFMYTVELQNSNICHILHAEILLKQSEFHINNFNNGLSDLLLADENIIESLATIQTYDGDALVWARRIFYNAYDRNFDSNEEKISFLNNLKNMNLSSDFKNVSTIYSGHTIVEKPIKIFNKKKLQFVNLDTGNYKNYYPYSEENKIYGLSICDINSNEIFTVRKNKLFKNKVCKFML